MEQQIIYYLRNDPRLPGWLAMSADMRPWAVEQYLDGLVLARWDILDVPRPSAETLAGLAEAAACACASAASAEVAKQGAGERITLVGLDARLRALTAAVLKAIPEITQKSLDDAAKETLTTKEVRP